MGTKGSHGLERKCLQVFALGWVAIPLHFNRLHKQEFHLTQHQNLLTMAYQAMIIEGIGKHFDPRIVDGFLSIDARFDATYARLMDVN